MRKKMLLWLSAVFCALVLCFSFSSLTASAATQAELKAKQDKLEAQQAQIRSKISQLEKNQASAQDQYNAINELIENLTEQIDTVNDKIAAQEEEIADIQHEIDSRDEQIDDAYNNFKNYIRTMYLCGDITGGLELLLSVDDFDSYLTTMTYIDITSMHINEVVGVLTEEKDSYQAQKALLDQKLQEVELEKANLAAKKEELDDQKAEADSLLSQLAADKAALQAQQVEIDKQMKAAREAMDAIVNNATANSNNTTYVGGTWRWPTPGYGNVTSKFGWRSWSNSYHKGIDIGAPLGANIIASNGGKVVTSSYDANGYGNYVIIDHGGGYLTVYGHMSKKYVSVGDMVSQGTVIGLCGSTGRSSGPHLHFEIRINGNAVNPLNYL